MIKVLCAHCQQHIFNADPEKLSFPFTREMFQSAGAFNDWALSASLIDAWCPYCEQMPFFVNTEAGGLHPRLLIRNENCKPEVINVKVKMETRHALGPGRRKKAHQEGEVGKETKAVEPRGKQHAGKGKKRGGSVQGRKRGGRWNRTSEGVRDDETPASGQEG